MKEYKTVIDSRYIDDCSGDMENKDRLDINHDLKIRPNTSETSKSGLVE